MQIKSRLGKLTKQDRLGDFFAQSGLFLFEVTITKYNISLLC